MRPTGLRPVFTPRLDAAGFKLPPEIFTAPGMQRETRTGRR
jgi:pilus assembly protein CpaF